MESQENALCNREKWLRVTTPPRNEKPASHRKPGCGRAVAGLDHHDHLDHLDHLDHHELPADPRGRGCRSRQRRRRGFCRTLGVNFPQASYRVPSSHALCVPSPVSPRFPASVRAAAATASGLCHFLTEPQAACPLLPCQTQPAWPSRSPACVRATAATASRVLSSGLDAPIGASRLCRLVPCFKSAILAAIMPHCPYDAPPARLHPVPA